MPRLCSFGCRPEGETMHSFPNPDKYPDRFRLWVSVVGGKLDTASDYDYYRKQKVCEKHFKDSDLNRNRRLNVMAVPSLNASGLEGLSSSDVQMLRTPSSVDSPADPGILQNLKIWAAEPDVCRCCLTIKGSWDLLATNVNEAGEKHVYSEILLSCFGISMSSLTEWGPGRMVCDICVTRLIDANTFKQQVLRAELQFVTHINSKRENVKANDEVERNSSPHEETDQPETVINESIHSASNEDINCSSETELEQIRDKPPARSFVRTYKRMANSGDGVLRPPKGLRHGLTTLKAGTDNLTPTEEDRHKDSTSEVYEYENDDDVALNVTLSTVPLNPIVILISERKRIKMTCETILRDTTACPFRHHLSWFQCFYCTQVFMEISSLRTHTTQAHNPEEEVYKLKRYPRSLQIDISEFSCKLCNLNLTDIESMQAHLKQAHNLLIYKECIADYKVDCSPFSCHKCKKEFHVFRTLTTHMNEHYANFICDVCGKSFINSKRLKVHNRTHESGCFPCAQCGKVLKTKAAITNHLESHSKRVIRCQICSKPMKHYNDRIKHMSDEHDITHKFKCPICAREFKIRHYLATHVRQTHGLRNKKCGECGMAFITNHGLKKHMQRHSGVKAYTCEVCSKVYARSHSLKEHMRIHDDIDQELLKNIDLSIHRA